MFKIDRNTYFRLECPIVFKEPGAGHNQFSQFLVWLTWATGTTIESVASDVGISSTLLYNARLVEGGTSTATWLRLRGWIEVQTGLSPSLMQMFEIGQTPQSTEADEKAPGYVMAVRCRELLMKAYAENEKQAAKE